MYFDIGLDLFPLIASSLAALNCGLLGNFLLLRKQSLMGDAISHSVLPGLVIAFLIASTRSPFVMLLGATIAGLCTVVLVEVVKRFGRVEPGAAMGVVFSTFFALGVLLIEKAAVRHVDLDAECVLHGQLELMYWLNAPESFTGLLSWNVLQTVPETIQRQVLTLLVMLILTTGFITVLFKELRVASFDPSLATSLGFNATLLHYLLMIFVAAATVASFEAVGSILVIAMLICPAAIARLLTDRLIRQLLYSALSALAISIGGYFSATIIPDLFGYDAVNAAGMMAVFAGILLTLTIVFSPLEGVLARFVRRARLSSRVALDDLLSTMYRAYESQQSSVTIDAVSDVMPGINLKSVVNRAKKNGYVLREGDVITLTEEGVRYARAVVRRHRLWEHYLVDQVGLAPDHVHDTAERLEHYQPVPPGGPRLDPHGKSIPSESTNMS